MGLFILAIFAQLPVPIADPITDYLENSRKWEFWDHEITIIETFTGDISGDGFDDVFVRSEGDLVERGIQAWEVYESSGDAYIRVGPVFVSLFYSFLGSMSAVEGERDTVPAFEHRLLTTSGGGDGNPTSIFWTYIDHHKVVHERAAELYFSNFDADLLDILFGSNSVQIKRISKADYLGAAADATPSLANPPAVEAGADVLESSDDRATDSPVRHPTDNVPQLDTRAIWLVWAAAAVLLVTLVLVTAIIMRRSKKMKTPR